jgi:FkbM family methyltransferase
MPLLPRLSRLSRKLPSSRNKARLGRIITRLLPSELFSSIAPIRMKDGSVIVLDARSRTEAGAFWNGEYEQDELDFFRVCVADGGTVLDVGANVGLVAIPLARHLKRSGGGKLIAIEPVKSNFDRLVQSIQLNDLADVVSPFCIALGDREGEVEFARENSGDASTGNAMLSVAVDGKTGYDFSTVKMTMLNAFAAQNDLPPVDFVKVDIEGAEVLFLRGGSEFLQQSRPVIYGEFNSDLMPKYGHTFLDVVAIVQPWDYRIFAFAGRLLPIEITQPEPGRGNVFLVPTEKAETLLKRIQSARQAST